MSTTKQAPAKGNKTTEVILGSSSGVEAPELIG